MTKKIRFGKTKPNQDPVYMPPSEGPFRCGSCEYFTYPDECKKEEMIKKQGHSPAIVAVGGCCNYFEKK